MHLPMTVPETRSPGRSCGPPAHSSRGIRSLRCLHTPVQCHGRLQAGPALALSSPLHVTSMQAGPSLATNQCNQLRGLPRSGDGQRARQQGWDKSHPRYHGMIPPMPSSQSEGRVLPPEALHLSILAIARLEYSGVNPLCLVPFATFDHLGMRLYCGLPMMTAGNQRRGGRFPLSARAQEKGGGGKAFLKCAIGRSSPLRMNGTKSCPDQSDPSLETSKVATLLQGFVAFTIFTIFDRFVASPG